MNASNFFSIFLSLPHSHLTHVTTYDFLTSTQTLSTAKTLNHTQNNIDFTDWAPRTSSIKAIYMSLTVNFLFSPLYANGNVATYTDLLAQISNSLVHAQIN